MLERWGRVKPEERSSSVIWQYCVTLKQSLLCFKAFRGTRIDPSAQQASIYKIRLVWFNKEKYQLNLQQWVSPAEEDDVVRILSGWAVTSICTAGTLRHRDKKKETNVWRTEKLSCSTSGVIQLKNHFPSTFSYENKAPYFAEPTDFVTICTKKCIKECRYKSLYSGYIIKKDNIFRNVSFFVIWPLQ